MCVFLTHRCRSLEGMSVYVGVTSGCDHPIAGFLSENTSRGPGLENVAMK